MVLSAFGFAGNEAVVSFERVRSRRRFFALHLEEFPGKPWALARCQVVGLRRSSRAYLDDGGVS